MLWDDFGPFVAPYVLGCSSPLIALHAKLAAIKFCTETKCWVRKLEPFSTDGSHLLEIDAATERARILDLVTVEVAGVLWPMVEVDEGIKKAQSNDPGSFCFAEDLNAITVYPLQPTGAEVIVRAVLVPALNAVSLSDDLQAHVEAISFCAVASLMRVPGQVFTNASSETFEAMFRDRIKAESSRLARGRIATTGRVAPSFI